MNELFTDAVDYRNYRFITKSTRYDADVASMLNRLTKRTDVQMKDQIFNRKDAVLMIVFLKDIKAACDA